MESLLLAIALFLSSPAGQDPNREPMWFDGCINIVEQQIDKSTWYYYCGDNDIIEPQTIEEWVEPNAEIEQFSIKKQTKTLPKKQKAFITKAKTIKATKTRSIRKIHTHKSN